MSSTEIRRDLPNDEYQAAVGANNASASNVFATIADLSGGGTGDADRVVFDAKYDQVGGIVKGQAVYISGSDGTNITVSKADYSTEATSSKTLGLAVLSGANNFQGQVISDGLLDGLDTSAAGAAGDPVWLGDDGNLIYGLLNKPYAPNHLVFIGIVTKKNASTGEIFVKVQNGFELDEIHNVDVKSSLPTDGQVLTYDSITGLWRNESLPSPVNIYTADGTVAGTRTVDLDGNTINFNDGKVGVNVTPGFPLQVRGTAIPSAGETIARFDVTDSSAYLSVVNGTATNGVFAPMIQGRQIGTITQPALQTEGIIDVADDTGTAAVTVFKTRLTGLLQVVTRPVFQFSNWTLDIMTMLANGNVGIGTTTPTEKLEVNGKTKTTTFQMTTTPTAGYVLTSDASGNGTWSPASSGGLTYFTEAQSTAAPNATVPVDSLTAISATTNADVAIVPKGSGALLAAIPDGTSTGGNKRGQYAVDLQMSRSNQVMVASGNFSAILGGSNNTVIGANSLAAGSGNSANGSLSFAIGHNNNSTNNNSYSFGNENLSNGVNSYSIGRYNNASGASAVAIGGSISTYNLASGTRSIAIGESNTASGTNAIAIGLNADTQNIYGRRSFANGRFANNGDAQSSKIVLRCSTSGATNTVMTSDGLSSSLTNQMILPNQSAYRFKGTIVAKREGSTDCASWDFNGFIVRGANAASTLLVASSVGVSSIWNLVPNTPTLTADIINGGLTITAKGVTTAFQNVRWVATIETTEVIYA